MGRNKELTLDLKEIYFDEGLYPRSSFNWQTSYDYSESMKSGAKFPPIIVAVCYNRKYLVDGKHRIEAYKLLKKDKIKAVVHIGWNKRKIFEEAVKANITHGRSLSPYEKRKIIIKLMEFKVDKREISKLVQVPLDKMESFVGSRTVNVLTGATSDQDAKGAVEITHAILKSGLKHYAGSIQPIEKVHLIEETQKEFSMQSQIDLIDQLIDLIENDLIDLNNPLLKDKYEYLQNLITKH